MKRRTPITQYCHERIKQMIKNPFLCIDATAGTGKDTTFLAALVGEKGRVISMDIQEMAIEQTKLRLAKEQLSDRVEFVLDSHAHMDRYAKEGSVSLIVFNLGYLPGGDHSIATMADSSRKAVETGLRLLKKGGLMTLCIYSGGDTGFQERDAMLDFIRQLDPHRYLVIQSEYVNRPNDPPIPVLIIKL